MIKRTPLKLVNSILEKNPNWKILDIGCGYSANKRATTLADIKDLSKFYKERNFVKIETEKALPFKDKEFDFVIASHVLEHVKDIKFFISELERISKKGYIELPTRLGDNLVFENVKEHLWWFIYDDFNNRLVGNEKKQLIEPFFTVSMSKIFDQLFRESFVIELFWEDKINYIIEDRVNTKSLEKINFFTIFRKYLSKKFRTFISRK